MAEQLPQLLNAHKLHWAFSAYHIQTDVKSQPIESSLGSFAELKMRGKLCIHSMVTSPPKTDAHVSLQERLCPISLHIV